MANVPRPPLLASMLITFLYYRDLSRAIRFYQDVIGLELAIDQGWAKIYAINQGGYIGLVDEAKGFHRAADPKPVMICLRVPDAEAWYRYLLDCGVPMVSALQASRDLGIQAFLCQDPEGYVLEIQEAVE